MSNVRDFGAVGDGVTDDTESIRHALKDGDGWLEFPRGDYRVTKTILVDLPVIGRISIVGLGGAAKILMNGPGPAFHLKASHASTADPAGFRPEEWQRERMPMIQDIEIEGTHPEADGVLIEGVMQPTLTGVLIREVRHALRLTQRARNLIVSHCHFYHNTGVGVFLDRVNLHQVVITGSHISYCRLGGIRIEESEIRNLQITGNDIEYNNHKSHGKMPDVPTAEIYIDVGKQGTIREGTIASNTLQATYSSEGANIRMIGGPETDHRAGMWTISGNLIGSQKNNVHLTGVRGVVITGNYIYSGHHRNILIERCRNIVIGPNCMGHNPDYQKNELATGIRLQDSENCNLSGLLIEDAEAGRHTVPNAVPQQRKALLEIVGCRRVQITGIQVLDPTPVGILLEGCSDTVLSSSMIHDQRQPKAMRTGVIWKGSGPGNMMTQCRVGWGIESDVQADARVTLQGNLQDG